MVFYIFAGLILIYGLFNYKKGFMTFLAFKLFLVQDITVVSIPGIPLLTLDMLMTMVYAGLYLWKKDKIRKAKISFPFLTPLLLLIVSWAISSVFSVAGISAELSSLIGSLLNDVIILVISWNIIEDKEDLDYLFELVTIVIFISCIYGFVEYGMQFNPLSTYEATLNNDPNRTLNYSYGIDGARGYHAKSIFEHAIGAGMIWALYSAFVFMSTIAYGEKLRFRFLAYLTAFLCIPLIMLTKQRSGMLFLIILAFTFIKPKKKRTYYFIVPAVIGLVLFYDQIIGNIQLLLSIFNSNLQNKVSGSSLSMRFEQLGASFEIMLRSPVWGLGSKYRNVLSDYTISLLRGVESIWFLVIPCYGIIGIISYMDYVIWSIYKIPRYFKTRNLVWLMTGYWIVNSISSLPGFKTYLLFLVVTYIIKKSNVYNRLENGFIAEWSYSKHIIKHRKIYNR